MAFDYRQRPATPEYHAGWELAFGGGESKPAPTPAPCTHDLVTFRFGKPYCIACGLPTSIGTKAEAQRHANCGLCGFPACDLCGLPGVAR
jgi:hypothetical protein